VSNTIRKQIALALVAAWNTDDRPSDVPELKRAPYKQQQPTTTNPRTAALYFHDDDPTLAEVGPNGDETTEERLHEARFKLVLRVIGTDSEVPEDVVDPVEAWAVKVWNGNTLNGLALYVRTFGTVDDPLSEDRPLLRRVIGVRVKHTSDYQNFEAQSA
jgi:hypothetical protein